MHGEFPQCLHFFVRNIGPFVFLEAEDEEPPVTLIGRNQGSGTAALSATSKSNSLLHDSATKVGVDQTLDHFSDSYAKCTVGQFRFPHPATEMPSLEYTLHMRIMPPSGIYVYANNDIHRQVVGQILPLTGCVVWVGNVKDNYCRSAENHTEGLLTDPVNASSRG